MHISSIIFLFSKRNHIGLIKKILLSLCAFAILAPFLGDVITRFSHFLQVGDLWRLQEIILSMETYSSSTYNMIFGNGVGVPYRELNYAMMFGDSSRLAINMTFDVHNLFVEILLKFGPIFLVFYLYFIFRQFRKLPNFIYILLVILFISQGLTSPAIFHSVDTLGFMLGLSLIINRYRGHEKI